MIVHPLAPDAAPDSEGRPAEEPGRLLVVNQIDHAAFSAEVLALWRADGLPEHPRRKALLRGTREHDNGWAEADSAPRVRGDGRPHDFRSIPSDARLEIFERAVRRKAGDDPEAWVYVVRHALALHAGDADTGAASDEDWRAALAAWRELEEELRAEIGLAEDELDADYRFLWCADSLSLAACLRWSDPVEVNGTSMWVTENASGREPGMEITLHLDPLPLAGATTFTLRGRVIPDRTYAGDVDLAMELASATWRSLRVRVAAA